MFSISTELLNLPGKLKSPDYEFFVLYPAASLQRSAPQAGHGLLDNQLVSDSWFLLVVILSRADRASRKLLATKKLTG